MLGFRLIFFFPQRNLWQTFGHLVSNFKKDLMNTTTCYIFQKFLYDEVVRESKTESKKMIAASGKVVNVTKLLRDLGFWAEVER